MFFKPLFFNHTFFNFKLFWTAVDHTNFSLYFTYQ